VESALGPAFKDLVDGAPAILYAARPDGTIAYANAAWTRFSGQPAEFALDAGWAGVVHPGDAAAVDARWLQALADARPFREEFRMRDAEGRYRWVVAHAQPSFGPHGEVTAWYGTLLDVDERRRGAQRRAILDRLGAAFTESIDFERTAKTVVGAMCAELADFAFVDVADSTTGRLQRVAVDAGRLCPDPEPFFRFVPPPHAPHPIVRVLRSGRAVIEHAVDDAWKRATTWSDEHLAFVRGLPIGSIAYVPMIAGGEHVGVLTFGTVAGGERSFSVADVGDVEEIARRAAVALANARLYRDLASSEALYRGLIDTAQEGVWIVDRDARTRYVNARVTEILGYTADEMYGRQPYDFMDEESARLARARLARVAAGIPAREETRLLRKDGSTATVLIASGPVRDHEGSITGALGMITDVTERHAIEEQYRMLAESSPQIVWSADASRATTYVNERWIAYTGIARDAGVRDGWTQAVHPEDLGELLAAWAVAAERAAEFEVECRVRRGADGAYRWHLTRARPRRGPDGAIAEWLGTVADVDATRRAADAMARHARTREIVNRASEALTTTLELDALLGRFAELLVRELGEEATIRLQDGLVVRRGVAPQGGQQIRSTLRFRDAELGRILVRGTRCFDPDDQALLDELAVRAAAAIDTAQMYAREHRVAMTLQRAMLPAVLPAVEGVRFDAVYFPGATEAEIGGDWYDAIAVGAGRVVVSIGDVTGRGLTAAVIMGRMRQAIESLATYESDPMRLLDAADRVLRRAYPDAIVTALVGVVDPAAGTFAYAAAGHPTPLLRAPDGTIVQLPARGLPLGLRDGAQAPTTTVALPPGALLVLYTDGLVEATRDLEEGERRTIRALADPAIAGRHDVAAALVAGVIDGAVRDDVAVLALQLDADRAGERPWTMRWRFDPRDVARTRDVREMLLEALTARTPGADAGAATLVFGELTANALRHAPGAIDVELTWDDGGNPVLQVDDDGPGIVPEYAAVLPGHDAESGRGLFLVTHLTRGFELLRRPERGTRARAELLAG